MFNPSSANYSKGWRGLFDLPLLPTRPTELPVTRKVLPTTRATKFKIVLMGTQKTQRTNNDTGHSSQGDEHTSPLNLSLISSNPIPLSS